MKKKNNPTVIIAAGGSGGHIFPAQALAEKLVKNNIIPILICDDRSNEFLQGELITVEKFYINSEKITSGFDKKLLGVLKLFYSTFKVICFLKKIKPKAVVGFGGYPSFPTVFAAKILGIRIIIHEQNAVFGRVNKMIAPFVDTICTNFNNTVGLKIKNRKKIKVIGNLIREDVLKKFYSPPKSKKSKELKILIIGGSQGAQVLSVVVPFALKSLPAPMQSNLTVYLQSRPNVEPKALKLLPRALQNKLSDTQKSSQNLIKVTEENFKGFGGKFHIKSFFDNIADLLANADLVIARAGASTISEIMLARKPAILIPLPTATENHQFYNAKHMAALGVALTIEEKNLTVEGLKTSIEGILNGNLLSDYADKYLNIKSENAATSLLKLIKTRF